MPKAVPVDSFCFLRIFGNKSEQTMSETMPETPSAIGSAIKASSAFPLSQGTRKVKGKSKTNLRFMESHIEYLACPTPVSPSTKVY